MRHYAIYNETGKLIVIGIGYGGVEITKEQYDALNAEIHEKAELAEKLYNGEITADDIPEERREEIQQEVNGRIETDEIYEDAVDVEGAPYTYEETDEPIEKPEEDEAINA
jgi:hypothetical protein